VNDGGAMVFYGRFFAFRHGLPPMDNTSLQLSISGTYQQNTSMLFIHLYLASKFNLKHQDPSSEILQFFSLHLQFPSFDYCYHAQVRHVVHFEQLISTFGFIYPHASVQNAGKVIC
jgi:hypothetical protein